MQQQDTMTAKNRKAFASLDFDMDLGGPLSFSDPDSGQVNLRTCNCRLVLPVNTYINWK